MAKKVFYIIIPTYSCIRLTLKLVYRVTNQLQVVLYATKIARLQRPTFNAQNNNLAKIKLPLPSSYCTSRHINSLNSFGERRTNWKCLKNTRTSTYGFSGYVQLDSYLYVVRLLLCESEFWAALPEKALAEAMKEL